MFNYYCALHPLLVILLTPKYTIQQYRRGPPMGMGPPMGPPMGYPMGQPMQFVMPNINSNGMQCQYVCNVENTATNNNQGSTDQQSATGMVQNGQNGIPTQGGTGTQSVPSTGNNQGGTGSQSGTSAQGVTGSGNNQGGTGSQGGTGNQGGAIPQGAGTTG